MILTVTLNAAIDKRYVVNNFKTGEVNRVKECTYVPGGKGLNVSKPASIYGSRGDCHRFCRWLCRSLY